MQKAVIELIDGTEATQTVAFSLDGVDYEIDLSEQNARRLRDTLAVFMANARKIVKAGGLAAPAGPPAGPHRRCPRPPDASRTRRSGRGRASTASRCPNVGRLATKLIAAFHDAQRAA